MAPPEAALKDYQVKIQIKKTKRIIPETFILAPHAVQEKISITKYNDASKTTKNYVFQNNNAYELS